VVRRFEEISHDTVTSLGGRVVKMIGDEVMFVVDNVVAAARIGLTLAEAYADDELLSDVRVSLAWGRCSSVTATTTDRRSTSPTASSHRQSRHCFDV